MSQRLIYVMDPMCSWCWGFAPVIDAIRDAHPGLAIDLVAGGLRPGVTDPMQGKAREVLAEHWEAVARVSGQPILTPDELSAAFIYNTEPACRALVVARELDAERVWPLVREIQTAFYTRVEDVTQSAVLADIAVRVGYARSDFCKAFVSEAALQSVAADFTWVAELGISGFPTLLAKRNGMLALLANGYRPAGEILPLLDRWVAAGGPH